MELYNQVKSLIDSNLIYCLVPIILTLMLVELFFKNRFETRKGLDLVKWIIILYSLISWTVYLVGMAQNPDDYAMVQRASGPYAWAYWLMFLSALILPYTLFIKSLAKKFWYVLFVAFAIKIGFYFERFVILTTSMHRDYSPENWDPMDHLGASFWQNILQGIILAIVFLAILEIQKRLKRI